MTKLFNKKIFTGFIMVAALGLISACDQTETPKPYKELAEDILAEAIAIKSVDDGSGSTVIIAEAMAKRLLDAGFPAADVLVTGPRPEVGVVVARYRGDGTGGKAIIVMAHMDVVDALPSDWNRDPFTLEQDETFFYGRGVGDNKAGVTILVANFIRMKQEGYVPNRDIIMILTGDEETTGDAINWLANERRDLIDADFALNTDAGGGWIAEGEKIAFYLQTSEKMYLTFNFTVRNSGGHSSVPRPDNAIYQLFAGVSRLQSFKFPTRLNEGTKAMFKESALLVDGQEAADWAAIAGGEPAEEVIDRVSQDSYLNALLRTTCVPTMLAGGHAENALPQTATATVNCRIFPGVSADEVEAKLLEVMDIEGVEVLRLNIPKASDPSPLRPDVMDPVSALVEKHFGKVAIIPEMSTGATDGLYLRNVGIPVYAMSALFSGENEMNAHGMDEKIRIESYFEALSFWYDLMKATTGGGE